MVEQGPDMAERVPEMSASEAFAPFLAWFTSRGGRYHDSLEFRDDLLTGPGLFSTSALPAATVLVDVPVDLCLTPWGCKSQLRKLLSADDKDPVAKEKEPQLEAGDWVVCAVALTRMLLDMRREQEKETNVASHLGEEEEERAAKRQRTSPPPSDPLTHLPYVSLMPSSILTPMHFRRSELNLLQATPLFHHGLKCRYRARRSAYAFARWIRACAEKSREGGAFFEWLVEKLPSEEALSRFEGVDEAQGIQLELETWDAEGERGETWTRAWRWAETSYTSRSFPPRLILGESGASDGGTSLLTSLGLHGEEDASLLSGPILIPGLDFFNHRRGQAVEWGVRAVLKPPSSASADASASASAKPQPTIYLRTDAAVDEGQQAWNNYGAKSNEELLGSYGFVLPEGADDAVTLVLGGGGAAAQASNESGGERAKFFWRRGDNGVPSGLVESVEGLLLASGGIGGGGGGEDGEAGQPTFESLSPHDKAELRLEALGVLEDMLKDKRRKMKASRSVDGGQADGSGVRDEVRRNVDVYRKGQESILKQALKWCGVQMARIEGELESCAHE